MQSTHNSHRTPSRAAWVGIAAFCALVCMGSVRAADVQIPAPSKFKVIKATPEHVQSLRAGGLVVYMRHGATDARYPDQIPVQLDNCASQRPLTADGRAQLDKIKVYVAQLKIPYSKVISSPFCRAVESAQRVFSAPLEIDPTLRYTAAMPEAEKAPAVARTRAWISRKVEEPGLNRIVVAHGPNIAEIMDYLPPETTLVIFRPLGEGAGFEYLASIEPYHWPVLLKALVNAP